MTRGWLFSSRTDLLLGCGIGSMAIMVVQGAVGGRVLAGWVPAGLLILLFSLPHYGATLVRVYEDSGERRKYRLFSVWATVMVACGLVAGLYSELLGSLLLTVYLTWSPWHYTGQNYGIALMLAGRRGLAVSPIAKRLLHTSFVTSFLLTVFAIHSRRPDASYAPVSYGGTVFELMPIGIPHAWVGVVIVVVGLVYLGATFAAIVLMARAGSLRAILPTVALIATQALWFALPVPVRYWDLAGEGSVFGSLYTPYGFLWIAAYHSVQYLWITTYFATESEAAVRAEPSVLRRRARFLGKATLMGYAVWTLPALVFAPGLLGRLPHESGLGLMVAAMVNIHHFILDGAVWKLRDGRVARVLLRAAPEHREAPRQGVPSGVSEPGVPWLRRTLQGLGALCVLYGGFTLWAGDFGFAKHLSRGEIHSAEQAIERLTWLGRDSPSRRTELGRRLAREGRTAAARAEFERSLSLSPTSRAYQSLGLLHEQAREWQAAATAYDSALELSPDSASTWFRAGRAWLEAGRPDRAVPALERAAKMAPKEKQIGLSLARARREADERPEP
jgi:hypothetical protein